MKRIGTLVLPLLSIVLLTSALNAQKFTGIIQGKVSDPSGAVLPNAKVTVTNLATGAVRTVTTNDQGDYTVSELEVGTYEVRGNQATFKESVVRNVEIHVASTTTVNIQLQLEAEG